MMLGADYSEVGASKPLGIYAKKDLRCPNPTNIAVNPRNGEVALADAFAEKILIFSPGQGNKIVHTCYQGSMSEPHTKFRKPSGVAYNTDGNLAVVDEETCVVQVFGDLGREFAAAFGAPRGTQPGELMRPSGVAWVGESLLLVLDAGNLRMHLFDTQGTFLGGIGGSQLLSQPVGLGYLPNGPMRGEDLWPRWFRRSGVRDALLAEIASSEPPAFLVRQDKESFELLVKPQPGVVDLRRMKEDTWFEASLINLRAGQFQTPPVTLLLTPSAIIPTPEGATATELPQEEEEGEEEEESEEESEDDEQEAGSQGKKKKKEKVRERVVAYGFPTLSQAVRYLTGLANCRWPEDGRRRALVAVLDKSRGCVQMFGHVASQGWSLALGGDVWLTPHTFFSMNVFGDFARPAGMCLDTFGNVMVADTGHERICIHRAESGLLLRTFPTGPFVRDLPYEYVAPPEEDGQGSENGSRPGTASDNGRESPPRSRPSSSQGRPPSRFSRSKKPASRPSVSAPPVVKDCGPLVMAYNRCKRGLGSEGEGSFVVLINKELYVYKAARRVGAGSLTNLETTIFRRACAFLSYEDGRKMAGGARFLRDMARRLRKEWELRPFNPRELMGTKRLFVEWCRTPYGHKLRVDAPPQDIKAPLAEGRTLICRHWVKDGWCAVFKLVGCPSRYYAPLDHDMEWPLSPDTEAGPPCLEFGHGLYCAVSRAFGFRYWYEREAILKLIFNRLAVDRVLTFHSERRTGDVKQIKHHKASVKVLDYRGFLAFMTLLHEDAFALRPFKCLPMLAGVDLDKLRRGDEPRLNFVQKHQATFEYQTQRAVDAAASFFELCSRTPEPNNTPV